jgi:regulator of protease activity HflC (stomatin/prohibitin superfamily)
MWKLYVKKMERGLLFKRGDYVRCLKSGKHRFNPLGHYSAVLMDMSRPFEVQGRNINLFLGDEELKKELAVVDVADNELVVHLEDGVVSSVLYKPGRYAFWKGVVEHTFLRSDTSDPEIGAEIGEAVRTNAKLAPFLVTCNVAEHETGLIYFNNTLKRVCPPGRYCFWVGPVAVTAKTFDLRRRQIDMTGQEIMTEDKVALRLNFVCHYRIADVEKVAGIRDCEEQLYVLLQLILREYVGSMKLDDLLMKKQEIGDYAMERLKGREAEYGVEFLFAGVKDVILPGEVKAILNTVLIAEKQALANVIMRREETASTRSLMNTARLMDENETLYKLKELEYLERICDKVGSISVSGSGGLLEQLNALLAMKAKE